MTNQKEVGLKPRLLKVTMVTTYVKNNTPSSLYPDLSVVSSLYSVLWVFADPLSSVCLYRNPVCCRGSVAWFCSCGSSSSLCCSSSSCCHSWMKETAVRSPTTSPDPSASCCATMGLLPHENPEPGPEPKPGPGLSEQVLSSSFNLLSETSSCLNQTN